MKYDGGCYTDYSVWFTDADLTNLYITGDLSRSGNEGEPPNRSKSYERFMTVSSYIYFLSCLLRQSFSCTGMPPFGVSYVQRSKTLTYVTTFGASSGPCTDGLSTRGVTCVRVKRVPSDAAKRQTSVIRIS